MNIIGGRCGEPRRCIIEGGGGGFYSSRQVVSQRLVWLEVREVDIHVGTVPVGWFVEGGEVREESGDFRDSDGCRKEGVSEKDAAPSVGSDSIAERTGVDGEGEGCPIGWGRGLTLIHQSLCFFSWVEDSLA